MAAVSAKVNYFMFDKGGTETCKETSKEGSSNVNEVERLVVRADGPPAPHHPTTPPLSSHNNTHTPISVHPFSFAFILFTHLN